MQRSLGFIFSLLLAARIASAGGPAYVAGASYFDPATMGTPLTWAQGSINYYTDQGNLSAVLPAQAADSFVAAAFGLWTATPTAAVSANRAGHLAEDVNGRNVTLLKGLLSMPADIQPSAVGTPLGIVYDADGSVTDALLGTGASNYCTSAGAFGGIDNFATAAQFLHALIILNGKCATSAAQLPDLQYHLVRVIGRVLGLDWSQANLNVITRNPAPTAGDYSGFPVMHEIDPPSCVPVAICYSNNGAVNPSQPKMDDQAALSRLYPVTAQNAGSFPGKKIFAQNTARIHGTVYFYDPGSGRGQPMQGVNAVARWIDPTTGLPSRAYVATSVSGFLFCGNAGNIVTGYTDPSGQNFNRFGSSDQTVEGFFDLAGLQIPNGTSAQYQLTIEAVDPLWSENVGPYGSTLQVKPSGIMQPVVVAVSLGSDTQQDIVMQASAAQTQQWYGTTTYASPAQLPASGSWSGVLSPYGNADFFQFPAQANRTLSVIVNSVDEAGNPSTAKAAPVIGMWALADPGQWPAPANTPSSFNTTVSAETRLDAQILQSGVFRVGIADYRGDGRPDYAYNARVFYGESLSPARASVAGGTPLTIQGFGLHSNTTVQIANITTPVLAASPTQLLIDSPAALDGLYNVALTDAKTGGNSAMTSVLTIGAGPADKLNLISGGNPATPVGGQAPLPFSLMVVASDNVTPVAGASVQFSSSPPVAFSACSGASSCTVLTDQTGMASTFMTVLSPNVMTLTAKLAPASYSNPQQVQGTLLGVQAQLQISLLTTAAWVAQGATVSIPLTARVLSNGSPVSNATVNYQIMQGAGILSAGSAPTNATGDATSDLQLNSATTGTQVSVCVAPNNNPCQTFNAFAVPTSALQIQAVSGVLQIISSGQSFQPVVVRVVDSASPPHPVIGANVFFQDLTGRLPQGEPIIWAGEAGISQPVMPVIVAQSQITLQSDMNGLVNFPLSTGGTWGNVAIAGSANVGNSSVQFQAQQLGQ